MQSFGETIITTTSSIAYFLIKSLLVALPEPALAKDHLSRPHKISICQSMRKTYFLLRFFGLRYFQAKNLNKTKLKYCPPKIE
jgi:hypothetical protein